jgi:hypothetical protein
MNTNLVAMGFNPQNRILSLCAANTNRIQREFSCNVAIATQERRAVTSRRRSRPKFLRKIRVFFKLSQTFTPSFAKRGGVQSIRAADSDLHHLRGQERGLLSILPPIGF